MPLRNHHHLLHLTSEDIVCVLQFECLPFVMRAEKLDIWRINRLDILKKVTKSGPLVGRPDKNICIISTPFSAMRLIWQLMTVVIQSDNNALIGTADPKISCQSAFCDLLYKCSVTCTWCLNNWYRILNIGLEICSRWRHPISACVLKDLKI